MNYQEFKEKVLQAVSRRLGDSIRVELKPMVKNNGVVCDGIIFRTAGADPESMNACPVIHLNGYYEEPCDDSCVERAAGRIIEVYEGSHKDTQGVQDIRSYRTAREQAACCVVNYEKNLGLLETIPHKRFLNLAVDYRIFPKYDPLVTVLVTDALLGSWGVTADQLYKEAFYNASSVTPHEILRMSDVIADMIDGGFDKDWDPYILTNTDRLYGAAQILYPSILHRIADDLDSDFLFCRAAYMRFLS